jgi:hypothetical protein
MNNLKQSYEVILSVLKKVELNVNFLHQIRTPKLSDIELIALVLTAEYLSIDSEYQLFRMIPSDISDRIERSVFNRRKRKLFGVIEMIRNKISEELVPFENFMIVDSMPLEVCKLSRATRSKICREDYDSAPDKGYCASQKLHFYGYKLHAVTTLKGVFKSFEITKASVHDIHYLKNIKQEFSNCTIIGDKGYLSAENQLDLFETKKITLEVPMRQNQQNYKPQSYIFKKSRKRIETLLSQLCDQFMVRRNYAKTFDGFKTRILAKLTSLTIIQFINHLNGRNINNIKISIS